MAADARRAAAVAQWRAGESRHLPGLAAHRQSIVVFAGGNDDRVGRHLVNQAVFIGEAARPESLQVMH